MRIWITVAATGTFVMSLTPAWAQSAATSPAMSAVTLPAEVDPPLPLPPGFQGPSAEVDSDPAAPLPDPANALPDPAPAKPIPDAAPPTVPPAPSATALPAGSGNLDSATMQRIVDRLVAQRFLGSSADAQNSEMLAQAIRDFQSSAGISPTGTLDRDTIGRLTTP